MSEEHEDFVPLWARRFQSSNSGRDAVELDLKSFLQTEMRNVYRRRDIVKEYLSRDDTPIHQMSLLVDSQCEPSKFVVPPTCYDEVLNSTILHVNPVCFQTSSQKTIFDFLRWTFYPPSLRLMILACQIP